jgi:HEPN domain-containing protein
VTTVMAAVSDLPFAAITGTLNGAGTEWTSTGTASGTTTIRLDYATGSIQGGGIGGASVAPRPQHDYWPEICWHSHQMCEKLMKALLVSRFVRPKRTHDLTELLKAIRQTGIDVGPLDAECELLTKHAITPRYPAGMGLAAQNARDAYSAAQRIAAGVRAQMPRC